jgi:DNA mismatch endonuclease (patch repair protein)
MVKVLRFTKENGFKTTPIRSQLMTKIRSTNTTPEILLRKELWARGIRYRVNYKKIIGSPDIIFLKKKVAVFIDGEFWHGYNWDEKKAKIKSNRAYWIPKIERNMQRDIYNNKVLAEMGYTVIRFWEREIKKDLARCVQIVMKKINLYSH